MEYYAIEILEYHLDNVNIRKKFLFEFNPVFNITFGDTMIVITGAVGSINYENTDDSIIIKNSRNEVICVFPIEMFQNKRFGKPTSFNSIYGPSIILFGECCSIELHEKFTNRKTAELFMELQ